MNGRGRVAEPTPLPARAVWRFDLAVAAVGLTLLLLWDAAGRDLAVMRLLGGPTGFAWRNHPLTSTVLHDGGRWLSAAALGLFVFVAWRPALWWKRVSAPTRAWQLTAAVLCLVTIPLLKKASLTSCPWDLREFGGQAVYLSHWAYGQVDGGPGHCFPSGHASGAFAFLAGYFALREVDGQSARAWLASVMLLGVLFGAAQTLRGAHYPSHTLYTAWICWSGCALSHHALRRWQLARRSAVNDRAREPSAL